jgi:ribulose-5-phosphate 4-epimerase/fuculose-1-phosphate aldolase
MTDTCAISDRKLREALISGCRELTRLRLSQGTSGNIGLRRDERRFFVSPTGMSYDALVS